MYRNKTQAPFSKQDSTVHTKLCNHYLSSVVKSVSVVCKFYLTTEHNATVTKVPMKIKIKNVNVNYCLYTVQ